MHTMQRRKRQTAAQLRIESATGRSPSNEPMGVAYLKTLLHYSLADLCEAWCSEFTCGRLTEGLRG